MAVYGSNRLFKALHDWRETCGVVAGIGNSAVRAFCFWLDEKGYHLYNAKTEGVFDLRTEKIIMYPENWTAHSDRMLCLNENPKGDM